MTIQWTVVKNIEKNVENVELLISLKILKLLQNSLSSLFSHLKDCKVSKYFKTRRLDMALSNGMPHLDEKNVFFIFIAMNICIIIKRKIF